MEHERKKQSYRQWEKREHVVSAVAADSRKKLMIEEITEKTKQGQCKLVRMSAVCMWSFREK